MCGFAVFWAVIAFILAIIWCYQFVELMLLSETNFPGKHDKILWALAFCALPPLAPFAFSYWMHAYLLVRNAEKDMNEKK
jgi:hypothetical protein